MRQGVELSYWQSSKDFVWFSIGDCWKVILRKKMTALSRGLWLCPGTSADCWSLLCAWEFDLLSTQLSFFAPLSLPPVFALMHFFTDPDPSTFPTYSPQLLLSALPGSGMLCSLCSLYHEYSPCLICVCASTQVYKAALAFFFPLSPLSNMDSAESVSCRSDILHWSRCPCYFSHRVSTLCLFPPLTFPSAPTHTCSWTHC